MRRFQFRLERFLELRRHKEREQEIALAKVLGECMLLKNRIEELSREADASRARSFRSGGRFIDVESLARVELYIQRLVREREKTKVRLAEKTLEMEEVRARYLVAAKERKVLDKLRERRSTEYYDQQKDEEFKAIDDINTAATLRTRW